MVSVHPAMTRAAAVTVIARAVRSRQAGTGLARRSSFKISEAVDGRRANEPLGSGRCTRARSSAGPMSSTFGATWARPKRSSASLLTRTWP